MENIALVNALMMAPVFCFNNYSKHLCGQMSLRSWSDVRQTNYNICLSSFIEYVFSAFVKLDKTKMYATVQKIAITVRFF